MRGRVAAAVAAVLVGLASPGALPFAPFSAAAAVAIEGSAHRVETIRAADVAERAAVRGEWRAPRFAGLTRIPTIYRTPSGPLPSQAPPAA
jgi:hypothetical protein